MKPVNDKSLITGLFPVKVYVGQSCSYSSLIQWKFIKMIMKIVCPKIKTTDDICKGLDKINVKKYKGGCAISLAQHPLAPHWLKP